MVEWLWPSLCDLFSPWLVPYFPQQKNNTPSNWIQQATSNNPVLLPWSESNLESAQKMIQMFVNCINFLSEMLPANTVVLGHIFYWYEIHFANPTIPKYVLQPIHSTLKTLDWSHFVPSLIHIESIHKILNLFLPDCHDFVGHIFLNVDWPAWLQQNFNSWNFDVRYRIMSSLLMIFVKLSCEPHIRESSKIISLLMEACNFPWQILEYQSIEAVLDWFIISTEPSIVLKMQSEHQAVDNGVLDLLQVACCMSPTMTDELLNHRTTQIQSKRILYVRSIVRLLRACGTKYQQLLTTSDGLKSFRKSVGELLNLIELIENKREDNLNDGINLMIEVVCSFQGQGEVSSRIFIESIILWQGQCEHVNVVLLSTFNAISTCKVFTYNLSMLFEETIWNYFKKSKETEISDWSLIEKRVGTYMPPIDWSILVQNGLLLTLQYFSVSKLKSLTNMADRITFLENLHKWLENFKTM